MDIKTYKVDERCNSRVVKRTLKTEAIVHDSERSELRIELSDAGEFDNALSFLLTDKTEMKLLRSQLTHAINDKTYR